MKYDLFEKIGIGTDIEEIRRFENFQERQFWAFLEKNYSKPELDYCMSKDTPAPHLAVRFAGKEAVIKALCSINITHIFYPDIEIINNESGVPNVRININKGENIRIKLSLSHCSNMATAFCIIEKES